MLLTQYGPSMCTGPVALRPNLGSLYCTVCPLDRTGRPTGLSGKSCWWFPGIQCYLPAACFAERRSSSFRLHPRQLRHTVPLAAAAFRNHSLRISSSRSSNGLHGTASSWPYDRVRPFSSIQRFQSNGEGDTLLIRMRSLLSMSIP